MAYKCKIFEAVNLRLDGHYTYVCTVPKVIDINTDKKTCLPDKDIMCPLMIKNKYGCQMQSTYAYSC